MKDINSSYNDISPKYIVTLVSKIERAIWDMFDESKYKNVKHYILRWQESDDLNGQKFQIFYMNNEINLSETLHNIPSDLLIKIAIDLGIDTPGFLPSIPEFKNLLKDKNQNAFQSFDRAIKNIQESPDEAVSLANSTLEGVIKTILSDDKFADLQYNSRDTLYKLTEEIMERFKMYPNKNQEIDEIKKIGSGLLTACQNIESLRSTKTKSHGKDKEDYIITDVLWATFIVNAVATIGLFMSDFFEKKINSVIGIANGPKNISSDDNPF